MVRVLAIPIIFFWGLLAVTTNTFMPEGGRRRRRTRRTDGPALRAVAAGAAAHRREVPRVQLDQPDHGRAGGRPTAGTTRTTGTTTTLMRRLEARHQARAVRDGSVGQADHRGGGAERRRQGHLCAVASRRRHRPDPSQPVRGRRPRHRREGHATARAQGLRQRRGPAGLRHAVYRQCEPEQHHDRDDHPHRRDAAAGVPHPVHPAGALAQRAVRDARREGRRLDPRASTGTSSSRRSR